MSILFWGVILAGIFLIFMSIRAKHFKRRMTAIFIILLLLFVYITASRLVANHQINVKSGEGVLNATKLYLSWLVSALKNMKSVVGNAVKMDWSLNNETAGVK